MIIQTESKVVKSPECIAAILKDILKDEDPLDQDKEHFWVIGLDCQNRIKYIDLVHLGCSTYVPCSPVDIFRRAVHYGVNCIIISHNHPSGNLKPSIQDLNLTKMLKDGAKTLEIKLLDHVIINRDGEFTSLNELQKFINPS